KAGQRPQGAGAAAASSVSSRSTGGPAMHEYGSLGLRIKTHWQRCRPKMYAELERQGALDEAVATAADLTRDALAYLISEKGMAYDRAWELVREEWAFLPEEDED